MSVKNKIMRVDDTVCFVCGQCFQEECKAFCAPYNEAECKHRMVESNMYEGEFVPAPALCLSGKGMMGEYKEGE